jgi:hypothetical protein
VDVQELAAVKIFKLWLGMIISLWTLDVLVLLVNLFVTIIVK